MVNITEIITIILLVLILFIYIQYILKQYKINKKTTNKNILIRDYNFLNLNTFIYFLIPFYLIIIPILIFFWKSDSIDKALVLIIFDILLIIQVIYCLIILSKKIELKEKTFIYSKLLFKKEYEYQGLELYYHIEKRIIYKGKRKIMKLSIYIINHQSLIDKIIEINGYECILRNPK